MTKMFLCLRLHVACANIRNNKNLVIFIFVIAVEYEINFTSKKFPELRYMIMMNKS